MRYGLADAELEMILGACAELPAIEEVILFGSRAMGNHRRGSDVDLAVKGKNDRSALAKLSWILNEELPLPYYFDVVQYETLSNPKLIEHIDRVGVVIYEGQKQEA